jgi:hypothetical protein
VYQNEIWRHNMKANIHPPSKYILLLILVIFALPMSAYAENIQCPPSMNVSEKVVTSPENWEGYVVPKEHYLDNVMFSNGHPSGLATLVPDKTIERKAKSVSTWLFPGNDSGGFWLSCTYHNTSAVFTKRLPKGTKRCVVTSKLTKSGTFLQIESIVCE